MEVRYVKFVPRHRLPSVHGTKPLEPPASSAGRIISGPAMVADELLRLGIRFEGFDPQAHSSQRQELSDRFAALFELPAADLKFERPRNPLELEVAEVAGLGIPEEMLELLLCCAAWEIDPPFTSFGRSAWAVPRSRLASLDDSHSQIGAFKLKAVGARGEEAAHPPRDRQFFQGEQLIGKALGRFQVLTHLGVREDGSFFPVVDPPKPIGGMRLSRAEAEFMNASRLMANGVPAVKPVAYGKYIGLTWAGEPMGFVILALPSRREERIGAYFEPPGNPFSGGVRLNPLLMSLLERRFDLLAPGKLGYPVMKVVCELSGAIGSALRAFHRAGLCRFAGHTGNFQYDLDKRVAILHDLDSSVPVDSLPEKARGFSLIRDIESALFGFQHSLLHSAVYKLADQATLQKCNPFNAMLQGYFRGELAEEEILKTGRVLLDRFIAAVGTMPDYGSMDFMFWFTKIQFSFTEETMESLMPLFAQSVQGSIFPFPYGPGPLFRSNMARFCEESKRVGEQEVIAQIFRS